MQKAELIIFDCDGVLVDSEYIANQCKIALLKQAGVNITEEELTRRFCGLRWETILQELEKETDFPLSATLLTQMKELFISQISQISALENIAETLAQISLPKAVASNSTCAYLKTVLKNNKLYDFFAPHIYSAFECGTRKLKPAPDIYLYIAEKFQVEAKHVFVIEDSVPGVQAAVAAGMRVIGFTGASHTYKSHCDFLMDAGAETVISQHHDLIAVIHALEQWQDF